MTRAGLDLALRAAPFLVVVLAFTVAGCVDDAAPASTAPVRPIAGAPRTGASFSAPLTLEEYVYDGPNATGAWAAAIWIRSEQVRACDFHITGTARPGGGTWDSIGVVAKGWKRPELVGRFDHGFSRGDGYVAHAGTDAANQSLKQPAAPGPDTLDFDHRRRVDLPTEALVVVGNTYMAPPKAHRPGLHMRLSCDGVFQVVHVAETARLLAYGPEDFDGTAIADTIIGLGLQRGATKTLQARDGFVVLLHEDGNQGNAEYTTRRPDSTTQTDTFGNRVVVGGAGTWRFGLNRVSPSPQGEFRLFALDVALPATA